MSFQKPRATHRTVNLDAESRAEGAQVLAGELGPGLGSTSAPCRVWNLGVRPFPSVHLHHVLIIAQDLSTGLWGKAVWECGEGKGLMAHSVSTLQAPPGAGTPVAAEAAAPSAFTKL